MPPGTACGPTSGSSHYVATGTLVVARDADDWVEQLARLPRSSWSCRSSAGRRPTSPRRLPFLDLGDAALRALHADRRRAVRRADPAGSRAPPADPRGVALAPRIRRLPSSTPCRAAIRTADGARGPGRCPDRRRRALDARACCRRLRPASRRRGRLRSISSRRRSCVAAWRRRRCCSTRSRRPRAASTPCRRWRAPPSRSATTASRCSGDPDRERAPTAAELATVSALAALASAGLRALPGARGQNLLLQRHRGRAFIVERCANAWILAGFSGHGFKFGALIGERVAAALAGEQSADELAAWAAGRHLSTLQRGLRPLRLCYKPRRTREPRRHDHAPAGLLRHRPARSGRRARALPLAAGRGRRAQARARVHDRQRPGRACAGWSRSACRCSSTSSSTTSPIPWPARCARLAGSASRC